MASSNHAPRIVERPQGRVLVFDSATYVEGYVHGAPGTGWLTSRAGSGRLTAMTTDNSVPEELSVSSEAPDRNLALELCRVTEAAAMAAGRWVGRGDKNGADKAAVDAMRRLIGTVEHSSNAGLCDFNRGLTDFGVRIGYKF